MKQETCVAVEILTWGKAVLKPLVLKLENIMTELLVGVQAVCFLFGVRFASGVDVDGLLLFIDRIGASVTWAS